MQLKKVISKAAAVLFLGTGLFGCSNASGQDLKVLTQKTVELGDPVTLNAADYLLEQPDTAVLEKITVDSPLKTDTQYSYNTSSKTVTTAGRDFLQVGTYKVTLEYDGHKYPVTLVVKDTTMPVFVSPAAVLTIPVGEGNFDFAKVYRTQDKDKVMLKIDGEYDLNKVGTYPVTLIATDASGNTNSLEITINVVGKNQQIKATDQFDDELVPSEENTYTPTESTTPATSQSSSLSPDVQNPIDPNVTEPEQPVTPDTPAVDPSQTTPSQNPGACTISHLPAGTQAFYSFSDLYAAGTAWNKQSANNYFYYLEGVDDCGTKIYALTLGTQDPASPSVPSVDPSTPADPSTPTDPAVPEEPSAPSIPADPTAPSDSQSQPLSDSRAASLEQTSESDTSHSHS